VGAVFGLTGGIATGKSTLARLLRERGARVIDADAVAREVVAPGTDGLEEVVARFGDAILTRDGVLNREALGALVFADPAARADLNAILHPRIAARSAALLAEAAAGAAPVFYEAALLFETGSAALFDEIVVVGCSPDLQLARVIARDGLTPDAARARIAAQMPLPEKRARATLYIDNVGPIAELERWADRVVAAARDGSLRPIGTR
jgi:dephospho-CoA kinase